MSGQRLVPVFLVLAAVAHACGPRSRSTESAPADRAGDGAPLASALDVRVADGVRFAFSVANHAAGRLELRFPSGQTHEFAVLDTLGRPVWRWSDERMFTQAMQSRVLRVNESVDYRATWDPAALRGTFEAVATLRSDNHPVERRARFTIP